MMINFGQCRPESRGEIALRSPNPEDRPAIRANYLDAPQDRRMVVEAARLARRVARAAPFADLVEEELWPPPEAEDDVWSLSNAERKAMGYDTLPENLAEAIDVMSGSELVAEVLGEHVFDFFLRNKRSEWEAYRREVTPYERQRYMSL